MATFSHRSFSGGEIDPALQSRVDTQKYQTGLKTCRNFIVMKHGGVTHRPGTRWVGESRYSNADNGAIRLIPWVYSNSTSYILEFGHKYFSVIKNGAYVQHNQGTVTATATSGGYTRFTLAMDYSFEFQDGDIVKFGRIAGTCSNLENRELMVYGAAKTGAKTGTIFVTPLGDNVSGSRILINGTITNTGSSDTLSMTVSKRYINRKVPYESSNLAGIRYNQDNAVMTLTHGDYPIVEIRRQGTADVPWNVTIFTPGVAPKVLAPFNPVIVDANTTGTKPSSNIYKRYAVSVVDEDGVESLPTYSRYVIQPDKVTVYSDLHNGTTKGGNLRLAGTSTTATITNTGSARKVFLRGMSSTRRIYDSDRFVVHGTDYNEATITEILDGALISVDSTQANWNADLETVNYFKTVTRVTSAKGIADGTGSAEGRIKIGKGAADHENILLTYIDLNEADDNQLYSYRIYRSDGGAFGLIGETTELNFHDIGLEADYTSRPKSSRNPFSTTRNLRKANFDRSPRAVGAFQQRRVFCNQDLYPARVYLSATGSTDVFDYRSALKPSDSFFFDLASNLPQRIQHVLSLQKLILFTDRGEWVLNGGQNGAISPTEINAIQYSQFGSGAVAPVVVGPSAVFVQDRGNVVRDLQWRDTVNGYTGNDLTVFSGHLFRDEDIEDMCYQQGPDSIIWCVNSDGKLLGLTYLPEHNIFAWHKHDIQGADFTGAQSIFEGSTKIRDIVYAAIEQDDTRGVVRLDPTYQTNWTSYRVMDKSVIQSGWNNNEDLTLTITTGTTYAAGQTLTLTATASADYFANWKLEAGGSWVGKKIVFGTEGETPTLTVTITAKSSDDAVTGTATVAVPAALQNTATSEFGLARNEVSNLLWHLVGENVSVVADGVALHSPYNSSYTTKTVNSTGSITLSDYYVRITVGLPIVADFETLDIDVADGETLADKKQLVAAVTVHIDRARGGHIGPELPSEDTDLTLMYPISLDEYPGEDSGSGPVSGKFTQIISPDWGTNGRVAIRHVDPYPMDILAVHPSTTPTVRKGRR